jgi:hypothetical protein
MKPSPTRNAAWKTKRAITFADDGPREARRDRLTTSSARLGSQ